MEIIFKKMAKKTASDIGCFLSTSLTIFSNPKKFFEDIEKTNQTFVNASSFALVASFILVLISIPSYKLNGISTEPLFIVLSVGISWFLLFLSGLQLFVLARLFRGRGSLINSISSYFYASSVLLILKMLEIPTRAIRDNELISAPLSAEMMESMNVSIRGDSNALVSEFLVFFGYIWFFFLIVALLRAIHGFGVIRGILVGAISMFGLSLIVSLIQRPILHVLLNAFKSA